MFRNVLPSLGSTLISLFKDTSLAAAIAVPELTFYARKINNETFRVVETWIVASCSTSQPAPCWQRFCVSSNAA